MSHYPFSTTLSHKKTITAFHLNRNHTVLADSIVDDFESLESGGKLNLADEATKAIILTSFMVS